MIIVYLIKDVVFVDRSLKINDEVSSNADLSLETCLDALYIPPYIVESSVHETQESGLIEDLAVVRQVPLPSLVIGSHVLIIIPHYSNVP